MISIYKKKELRLTHIESFCKLNFGAIRTHFRFAKWEIWRTLNGMLSCWKKKLCDKLHSVEEKEGEEDSFVLTLLWSEWSVFEEGSLLLFISSAQDSAPCSCRRRRCPYL